MFCPLGYTTLKRLWEVNRTAFSWEKMDLDSFFTSVFELDKGKTSAWMAKTLSTDELLEKVILEAAFEGGFILSSPSGQIMKMDVPFFISDTNFYHIMNSNPEFFSEDCNHFSPTHIYPDRRSKITKLKDDGKDPWWELRNQRGFCSINYYYDRDTYCISLEVYRRLEAVSHGYMSTETLRVQEPFIRPLEGWSICVTDEVAEYLSPTQIFERFRLKALCEALQLDEKDYKPIEQKSRNTVGRPKVSMAAAQAFLKHYSLDDRPSWKEAINKIRMHDGLDVSVRTLQRGLKEISDDKKRS